MHIDPEVKVHFDAMWEKDYFSNWLGMNIVEVKKGYCKATMTIKQDMLNGFGTVHGGVIFSFADSLLAFAANSHGKDSVALEANISFLRPLKLGDVVTGIGEEVKMGRKTSVYVMQLVNQENKMVAQFRGTVFHTKTT